MKMDWFMEVFSTLMCNVTMVLVIPIFIYFMYQNVYTETAALYIKNQISILISGSFVTMIVLTAYYFLESKIHLDEKYFGGICLTLFMLMDGILIEKFYEKFLKSDTSKYETTNNDSEYLFQMIIAFVAVSFILYMDKWIKQPAIPIALIIGRLIWFDTKSFKMICEAVVVKHDRIKESSVIYLIGVLISVFIPKFGGMKNSCRIFVALVYGLSVLYIYGYIRKYLLKCKFHKR